MDKILLNGMEFYGYHGVFKEEKNLDNPLSSTLNFIRIYNLQGNQTVSMIRSITGKFF